MKASIIIIILSICFSLFACRQIDGSAEALNEPAAVYVRDLNKSDTFKYEIPVNESKRYDSFWHFYKRQYEKAAGLISLEKGFDSIQIRIEYGCYLINHFRLVILKNVKGKWSAEASFLDNHYIGEAGVEGENNKIDTVYRDISYYSPKSGWIKFIDSLFKLKILSLEDNEDIPGFNYGRPTDGCEVSIEVATKNVYRSYSYDNPEFYNEKYSQANNVLSILKFINDEFSLTTFDGYWPPDKYFWRKYDPNKSSQEKINIIHEVSLLPDTIKN